MLQQPNAHSTTAAANAALRIDTLCQGCSCLLCHFRVAVAEVVPQHLAPHWLIVGALCGVEGRQTLDSRGVGMYQQRHNTLQ
jgi:hypothetical protein